MRRKRLLFATFDDERLDDAFGYAVELSRTLDKDLCVLVVHEKRLSERFDDLMTAVTFAEEYGSGTEQGLLQSGIKRLDAGQDDRMSQLMNRGRMSGVSVEVYTAGTKIVDAVNDFIRQYPVIDMVLLGPTVAGRGEVSAKQLKKLVSSVSRPVVTMARQALEGEGG